MIYWVTGFLAVVWFFCSSTTPPPPHPRGPSVSSTSDTQEDWERGRGGKRGGRGAESYDRKKIYVVLYKTFITLRALLCNWSMFFLNQTIVESVPSWSATELLWNMIVMMRPAVAPRQLKAKTTFAPVVTRASQGPQQQVPVRSRHHISFLHHNCNSQNQYVHSLVNGTSMYKQLIKGTVAWDGFLS